MAGHHPTEQDRREAIRIALSGLAEGRELGAIAAQLAPLHPRNDTFPGELLLEVAADALELAGASRESPVQFEGVRERLLPETVAHTKAQHHKSEFALRAAAMIHGGVDPGLLDEVQWWRTDDLWYWSLEALAVYVRAAGERTGQSAATIAHRIGARHDVVIPEHPDR